jgi:LPXTG-motif cell wall-anchored protein
MTSRKLASAAAAASLAGVAVLGMSAPAIAQDYPPAKTPPSASDSTVVLGQMFTLNSGNGFCFADPEGITAVVEVFDDILVADVDGNGNASASVTVPEDTAPGRQTATFECIDGDTVDVAFTVVAAAAAGPGQGQRPGQGQGQGQGQQANRLGSLPRTGTDQLVPLTITGVALVGIGAGIVVASRRRRETSMPSGLA